MGLFASRPEDPYEWAGLPSEPLRQATDAELLADPPVDPFAISAGGSITVTIPTPTADPVAGEAGDADDDPDAPTVDDRDAAG